MQKNNVTTALVGGAVGSAVLFSIVALNNYKPQLTKLAEEYVKNKKSNKKNDAIKKNKKVLNKAFKVVENIPEKINTLASTSKEVLENKKNGIIKQEIYDSLKEKVLSFPFDINNNGTLSVSVVNFQNSKDYNNTISLIESIMAPIFKPARNTVFSHSSAQAIEMKPTYFSAVAAIPNIDNNKNAYLYKSGIAAISIVMLLNYLGNATSIGRDFTNYRNELITETTEDIKDYLADSFTNLEVFFANTMEDASVFLTDTMDVIITFNDHESLVERKIDRIATSEDPSSEKIAKIFNLKDLTIREKIFSIINLEGVNYLDKFDFFIKSGNFTMEDAINIICQSKITSYQNTFNYIMSIESISFNEKINYILYSDITDYTNVFDYIMSIANVSLDKKLDYIMNSILANYNQKFDYIMSNTKLGHNYKIDVIANSNIATYEEKFDYFVNQDCSTYEKVWSTLQIPNVPFNKVFKDLLNIGIAKEEIIQSVMKTDLVSFHNIFDAILKIDTIDAEQISNYLIYYSTFINKSTNYNAVSLDEILNYALNIKMLTHEDKVNLFWDSLDGLSLNEKSDFILKYYSISREEFISLMTENKKELTEEENIVIDLFTKIYAIKEEYILSHYGFETLEQLKKLVAGCAAEAAFAYDDIYAVINTIFNRYTHPYYSKKGHNIYNQFTAPGQFAVYKSETEGAYLIYLYHTGYRSEERYKLAQLAVYDMLYDGYEGVKHNYIEFRWSGAESFSNKQFVKGGNRYKYELADKDRIIHEFLLNKNISEEVGTQNESVKVIILENQKTKKLSAKAIVLKKIA